MFTKCINDECGQKYKITSNMIGARARCRKCNTLFEIAEYQEPPTVIEFSPECYQR